MHGFQVRFRSFEDVRDFVFLASDQRFDVTVYSGSSQADGKSLMILLGLDYSQPLWVHCACDADAARAFSEQIQRFRV